MIREIIRPQQNQIILDIPEDYINKEVELIVFPLEEKEKDKIKNKENISSLAGSLSKYADPSKIDLESKAWKMHIIEKYK